jgi:hypothetical protein
MPKRLEWEAGGCLGMHVMQHDCLLLGDLLGLVLRCMQPTQKHLDGALMQCRGVCKAWFAGVESMQTDAHWFAPYTEAADLWAAGMSQQLLLSLHSVQQPDVAHAGATVLATRHMHLQLWGERKLLAGRVLQGMATYALSERVQSVSVHTLVDILRERAADEPTDDSQEFDYLTTVDNGVHVLLRTLQLHRGAGVQAGVMRVLNEVRKQGGPQTRLNWCAVARLTLRGMTLHPSKSVVQQQGCRALSNLSPLQVPVPATQCVAAVLAALVGCEAQHHHALRALLVLLQSHTYAEILRGVDTILFAVKKHVALLENGIQHKDARWTVREQLRGSVQIVLSGLDLLTQLVKGDATQGRVHRKAIATNPSFGEVRRAMACLAALRVSPWDNFRSFHSEYPDLARI